MCFSCHFGGGAHGVNRPLLCTSILGAHRSEHPHRMTFRLSQDPNSQHLGTTVWDASIVLAKYLQKVQPLYAYGILLHMYQYCVRSATPVPTCLHTACRQGGPQSPKTEAQAMHRTGCWQWWSCRHGALQPCWCTR